MRIVIDISEYDKDWIGNAYCIPQDINTKIAEAIINAEPYQTEPHWIPVTERLPDKDGNYLVSGKWESGKESVGDCEFEDGYFQTAWNFDVLAWCELPEPYKGVNT